MKKYVSPEVEFVVFDESNVMTLEGSSCEYECPNSYGSTCSGNPYGGI